MARDYRYLSDQCNFAVERPERRWSKLEHEEIQAQTLAQDIEPLMELVKDEPLPLSHKAAQKARTAYLKIENPVGRIFSCSLSRFHRERLEGFPSSEPNVKLTRAILGAAYF